jgi:hypothetical protein
MHNHGPQTGRDAEGDACVAEVSEFDSWISDMSVSSDHNEQSANKNRPGENDDKIH